MTEEIAKAIAHAIHEEFGDAYAIYSEAVPQGLQTPCFFVLCIRHGNRFQRDGRYLREGMFSVQYLPESVSAPRTECEGVGDRLLLCLEYIQMSGGPVRGTEMRYEIQDGVLHFFVHYDFFVVRQREVIRMEELIQKSTVKE